MIYCELCNTYFTTIEHNCKEKQNKKLEQLKQCPYCNAISGSKFISAHEFIFGNGVENVMGTIFSCGTERKQSKLFGWNDKRSTFCYQREIELLKAELKNRSN